MDGEELERLITSRHSEIEKDWAEWNRKSASLRRSSEVLRQQAERDFEVLRPFFGSGQRVQTGEAGIDLSAPIMMLNGLALETLVKALAAARSGSSPLKMDGMGASHRTRAMLDTLGIQVSEMEEELILRLETYVQWAGKYPTPRDAREVLPKTLKSGRTTHPAYSMFRLDEEVFVALYSRLRDMLPQEVDPGLDSK